MSTQKERKTFSLQEKMNILRDVDKHVGSRISLAKRLGISVSTLNTIVKNQNVIEKNGNQCGPMAKKRKYVKKLKFEELEDILKEWFVNARSSNLPVSGVVLQEKALHISRRLGIENFTASNGWIDRFKQCHNVVYKSVFGESGSVDSQTVDEWKKKELLNLIEGYAARDIFNVDETGLFYNVLPNKTLCFKGENCHGGKQSKLQLTVLILVNCDGTEKMQPLVIGKFRNPRCFKNIKILPTKFTANSTAWISSKIFEKELHALDAKMSSKNRKILLFLDCCPAHPLNVQLRNVKLAFFPPNCTSELQPLDLGIIHSFKLNYRKNLVQKAITLLDCGKDPRQMKVSVLDALHYIPKAWNDVKELTIKNCFKKAGISLQDVVMFEETQETVDADWDQVSCGSSFSDFVNVDAQVLTCEQQTINDIVNQHMSCAGEERSVSDEEDGDEEDEVPIPSDVEVMSALNTIRNYLSTDSVSSFDTVYKLEKKIEDIRRQKKLKQNKISDYFVTVL